MAKGQVKDLINENNPLNNPNPTPKLDSKLSKKRDRKEYSKQRYQVKKQEYHQWYLQHKTQKKEREKEQLNKYSGASAIKVLMSLKEYRESNQQKQKIWLDFIGILEDLNQIKVSNIIEVMRIRELADTLINDYWTTAKKKIKKGKCWNNLGEEQQQRLIKYWGREKVRWEKGLLTELEKQEKQGETFEKAIERQISLSKFHEKQGKIKCKCWSCEEVREKQKEKKRELEQIFKEKEENQSQERVECSGCGRKVKELDEENDVCRRCLENYG